MEAYSSKFCIYNSIFQQPVMCLALIRHNKEIKHIEVTLYSFSSISWSICYTLMLGDGLCWYMKEILLTAKIFTRGYLYIIG